MPQLVSLVIHQERPAWMRPPGEYSLSAAISISGFNSLDTAGQTMLSKDTRVSLMLSKVACDV